MGFKFQPQDEGSGVGVRRIALEQVEAALAEAKDLSNPDETIHSLRRRCKKLRGLLRLIKPNFKHFAEENAAIREAATGLAGNRDAAVMIKTLEGLREEDVNLPITAVRAMLGANIEAAAEQGDPDTLVQQFSERFEALQERIPHWKVRGHGFDSLADGLHDNYRRMRQEMDAAEASEDPNEFHEWRKAAKYFWHHLSLLSACAPAITKPYRAAVAELETTLGNHHDLTVLDEFVGGLSDPSVPSIQITIRQKRDHLGQQAIGLGRQLSAEKPDALVGRLGQYWALAKKGH
ncbi:MULTISPECIES: CHAD domain-containing protein [unclassified Devosia]|uniref:CHAD domain-containing protein n=1 Tax=unclassified Devosia TaxID=196773 RepID=UPI0015551216|nr:MULTISPECIES: CHAD domain-containing protein [unclassified Devosia]